MKVRRELRRHALNIELRDARNDEEHKQTLIQWWRALKVPCLQISSGSGEKTWLYESDDIILTTQNPNWNWRKQRMRPRKPVKL